MPIFKKNSYVKKTPAGYKDLEYIEANKAQYIDTGYELFTHAEFEINMDYYPSDVTYNYNNIFGYTGDADKIESWVNSGRECYLRYNNVKSSKIVVTATRQIYNYKRVGTTVTMAVGSSVKSITASTQSGATGNCLLLTDGGKSTYGAGNLYSAKLYADGTLVRDYIPALRTSDNVAGLYDLVNNVFYPSASSTAFVAGTILTNMLEITPDLGDPHKELVKIVYGGKVMVVDNWAEASGTIGETSVSSSNNVFTTDIVYFDAPIVPTEVYCYLNYSFNTVDLDGDGKLEATTSTHVYAAGVYSDGTEIELAFKYLAVARPSSGKSETTATMTEAQIIEMKDKGGIVGIRYHTSNGVKNNTMSCGGKVNKWLTSWTYHEGKFIDMTSNTEPSPFTVTYEGSGQYSKSGEYWHAFDDNSSTSLVLTATKDKYQGTNGYHNAYLKFGKPIRVVEWTATGSCTSSDNYRYASLELDGTDVGENAVFDGTYTKNYSDTELGYVEADSIHLHASRSVCPEGSTNVSSSATFKDVQITKWYEGGSSRVVERVIWESVANIDFVQEGGTGTITADRDIKGVLICSAYRNERGGGENKDCSITATSTGSKCEELSNDTWHQNKYSSSAGWWYGGKGNLRIYLVECKAGDTFTITSSYSGSATLINCGKSNAEVIPYDGGAQANFKSGIVIGVGHRGYGSSAVNISMSNGTCKSYEQISSTANGTGKRLIAKVSGSTGDTINFSVTSADYANGMMKLINIK